MSKHPFHCMGKAMSVVAAVALLQPGLAAFADGDARQGRTVIPIATILPMRLDQPLSSKDNYPGDRFTATIQHGPDDAGLPEGTKVEGMITHAIPAHGGRPGLLDVDFRRVVFPDGTSKSILGRLYSIDGKSVRRTGGRLIAKGPDPGEGLQWIGIGAGAGAVIGALTTPRHARWEGAHIFNNTVLGAIAGGIFGALQNHKPGDVNLKAGAEFGVWLNRPLDFVSSRAAAAGAFAPTAVAAADSPDRSADRIAVVLDDHNVRFDRSAAPFRQGREVFVPIESVARAAHIDYRFDEDRGTIYLRHGAVSLQLDSHVATVDGAQRHLPAAAQVRYGVVYVPMEFLRVATGDKVTWDEPSQTVVISTRS